MNNVAIYTDGACSGNPGVGGYAFLVLREGNILLKLSGGEKHTTNNRMELKAIVRALKHMKQPRERFCLPYDNTKLNIVVKSDSAYCVNAINQGWVKAWKANGWLTKQGNPVKNKELWEELLGYLENKEYNIKFEKVKGHSGNKYNEIVDQAAKNAITRLKATIEGTFQAEGGRK